MRFVVRAVLLHIIAIVALSDALELHHTSSLDVNPFHHNLNVKVSYDDDLLRKNLWEGVAVDSTQTRLPRNNVITYSLQMKHSKRAIVNRWGPLIKLPCLYCERKHTQGLSQSLSNFSIDKMKARIIARGKFGDCLFYGQRPEDSVPNSLSDLTTLWSCTAGLKYRTIWQMWPSNRRYDPTAENEEVSSCFAESNYYCLNYRTPKCCWLNPILGSFESRWQQNGLAYFKAMSRAMAQTCGETIYIMIDDITMVKEQYACALVVGTPSIWLYDELVELQKLFDNGTLKKAIAIRFGYFSQHDVTERLFRKSSPGKLKERSPERVRELKASAAMQKAHAARKAKDIMSGEYDQDLALMKRDDNFFCTDSFKEQDPDLDYYG